MGGSLSYLATVMGLANTEVTWSVQEGATGGYITSSGVYTAPNAVGTYHVVATSVADATESATAVVTTYLPAPMIAGAFTAGGDMTTARSGHTATLLGNGRVLIAGGWDGHQTLASAELYDPTTRTFAITGSMTTPRYVHSATLMADGRVLIAGGVGAVQYTNTAEIYDPSTGAFTNTGDLILGAFGGPTTLLPDGRVLVAAGNNAEIYDPRSGTFTLTGPFVDPGPIYPGTATLLTNGKVLVTGCVLIDAADGCGSVVVAELFDPQSGTFSRTGPMTPSPSSYAFDDGATLLADGRVLFVGDDDGGASDVEVYDPATGTFASPGGTIRVGEDATATRLTDGTVLIAGGSQGGIGDGIPDAELFVPTSGTFESAGQMTVGRYAHTATLLPDGTVLITGGDSFYGHPTSSAEVYKPR
jgi:hypothetical protein